MEEINKWNELIYITIGVVPVVGSLASVIDILDIFASCDVDKANRNTNIQLNV